MWRHILSVAVLVSCVAGHGRVLDPPSRASMWRAGFSNPPNYDDDGLNCGGFWHQYSVNNGRCGVCGDPFDMAQPREHELGGRYGGGQIVAHYDQGQVITTIVQISAYHKGFWEFRICTDPRNNNQECFDQRLLELEEGGTKYYPWKSGSYSVNYRLPADLVCDHCVLQWKYTAGNNWGVCRDGSESLGCGNQETFGACTDISIRRKTRSLEEPPVERSLFEGIIELLRNVAVRPQPTPKRDTPVLYQRKNHRRKQRKRKGKHRRRKKMYWNLM